MARLFWNTVNITDFGTGCWRELILVISWIFIEVTFFTPSTCLHRKWQRNFQDLIKWTPCPTVIVARCSCDISQQHMMRENGHSHLKMWVQGRECVICPEDSQVPNLTWKLVVSTLLSSPLPHWINLKFSTRNKIIQIHLNYQGISRLHS